MTPDVTFDGGDLDCGGGLLLLIRRHIDPLRRGQLLEIRSTEPTVEVELPAWCRLTGNELVRVTKDGHVRRFVVCKGALAEREGIAEEAHRTREPNESHEPHVPHTSPAPLPTPADTTTRSAAADRLLAGIAADRRPVFIPDRLPDPAPAPAISPLSVMGIGSWPRPAWLGRLLHERLEGRLDDGAFEAAADDAVRLAVAAQERAGVDVVTDGEQRRDNYASFVGARLDNCQLIPLVDLLPLVDDPAHFEAEMRSLDIPAAEVRHPAVFGPLSRPRPIAAHELAFARTLTDRPIKIALPGPYLLSRTMWLECVADKVYASREALSDDIVRVLREEVHALLAGGAAIVQFDEPVLTEVVFSGSRPGRSFMCGALSDRRDSAHELAFARDLLMRVVDGLPRERLGLHICRGNWSRDEANALAGDYRPLLPFLSDAPVGTLFLELCTPRAGEIDVLAELPRSLRIGVGVVNQKLDEVEAVDDIARRIERAVDVFGAERVLLTPDCGFATFADAPMAAAGVAERKMGAIVAAVGHVRGSMS